MEDTRWNRFALKDFCLWKGPMLEQVCPERLQPVGRTNTGSREKCEEEKTAERSCYGLTRMHFALCRVPLRVGEEVEKSAMEE